MGIIPHKERRDPLYAREVNDLAAAIERNANVTGAGGIKVAKGPGGTTITQNNALNLSQEPAREVRVVNTGDEDLRVYDAAVITGQYFSAGGIYTQAAADANAKRERILTVAAKKSDDNDLNSIVICKTPIAMGQVGYAYSDGVCLARVSQNDKPFARLDVGSKVLTLTDQGGPFEVLWEETVSPPTGVHLAVVRFYRRPDAMAKLQANISADALGNVKRCYYDQTLLDYVEYGNAFEALNVGPGNASSGDVVLVSEDKQSLPFFRYKAAGPCDLCPSVGENLTFVLSGITACPCKNAPLGYHKPVFVTVNGIYTVPWDGKPSPTTCQWQHWVGDPDIGSVKIEVHFNMTCTWKIGEVDCSLIFSFVWDSIAKTVTVGVYLKDKSTGLLAGTIAGGVIALADCPTSPLVIPNSLVAGNCDPFIGVYGFGGTVTVTW